MKGYAFYTDGHYEKFNTEVNKLDTDHLKFILLRLKSFLFGTAYTYVEKTEWKKIKNISDIKLKYDFIDGCLSDEDVNDITVHNRYHYNTMAQLYAKLTEICISEDVLNDSVWIHDCNYSYIFDKIKISFRHKDKKSIYTDCSRMYEDLGSNYSTNDLYEYITLSKNKYKTTKSHRKLKNQKTFVYYGDGVYFEINKDFYEDVKSLTVESLIHVFEYENCWSEEDKQVLDEIYAENSMTYEYNRKHDSKEFKSGDRRNKFSATYKSNSSIHYLLQCKFAETVIAKLESSNDAYCFRLFNTLKKLNGDKTHKDFDKFIHKYFPSIPKDEEEYSEFFNSLSRNKNNKIKGE